MSSYEPRSEPYKHMEYGNGTLTIEYFDGSVLQWDRVPEKTADELRKNHDKLEFLSEKILKRYRITRLN